MNNKLRMFVVAVLILTLILAAILGLFISPANPITWLLVASLVALPFLHQRIKSAQQFEWRDEYSVGIASIDQQHRKLIDLINNLQAAVDYRTGQQFEREALDALVDYTKTHFKFEEELMEDNGYPDFAAHKKEHKRMIARVEEVLETYRQDREHAMQDALIFLKSWLINHINGTDKHYSKFLIDKGVS